MISATRSELSSRHDPIWRGFPTRPAVRPSVCAQSAVSSSSLTLAQHGPTPLPADLARVRQHVDANRPDQRSSSEPPSDTKSEWSVRHVDEQAPAYSKFDEEAPAYSSGGPAHGSAPRRRRGWRLIVSVGAAPLIVAICLMLGLGLGLSLKHSSSNVRVGGSYSVPASIVSDVAAAFSSAHPFTLTGGNVAATPATVAATPTTAAVGTPTSPGSRR